MLIQPDELQRTYGVRPRGVLHVGAHEAEESLGYGALSWGPVIWVEMLPEKFEFLSKRFRGDPNNIVLHGACWDSNGVKLPVYRANNGQSSSLLQPDLHLVSHPEVQFARERAIRSTRLDKLLPRSAKFNFVNFDIQGAELKALLGLGRFLEQVKWAYLEVNVRPLYQGCALVGEVDEFMENNGFGRIVTRMAGDYGWGDALYFNPDRP
jgi:FkbM family methyltransferase